MRIARLTTSVAAFVALSVAPVYAQGHGGGHAASPTVTHGNPHTDTTSPKSTTSPKTTSSSTTTTSGGTKPSTTTVSPIAAKIASHPQLAAKCTALLPKGMTLNHAATGFRNQGQFIAALHVSRNHNIPFADLKKAMTGPHAMSLGQAIHKLRPSIDSDEAAEHATTQASTDLQK